MASFSDTLENAVLNKIFSGVDFEYPEIYLGMFKSDAGLETDIIADAEEVLFEETGYARVNVTDGGGFTTSTAGQVSNINDIEFPVAQADWGTITHAALLDAPTGGTVLCWGPLLNPRSIYNGDSIKVPSGAMVAQLS